VPVTGQPLPLVSKGGTSSIINCIYIGVILSVSRTAKKNSDDGKDATPKTAAATIISMNGDDAQQPQQK
jgi:cell division protein FtsW